MSGYTTQFQDDDSPVIEHSGGWTVLALFPEHANAVHAVKTLVETGFSEENIGVAASGRDERFGSYRKLDFQVIKDEGHRGSTAAKGAGVGGGVGALSGLLALAGVAALPALGPLLAAGTVVQALALTGLGAAAGGLIGALVGYGVPHSTAEVVTNAINAGSTLVMVHTDSSGREIAEDIVRREGATDVQTVIPDPPIDTVPDRHGA